MNRILLGPEDLKKHAVELAKSHVVGRHSKFPKWLITRMEENYKQILQVYETVNSSGMEGITSSSTTEWLLDNFYIIEEQVKDVKFNVFKKHCFRLPLLHNQLSSYPRIYDLALNLVAATDGMIDEKTLTDFIRAYQTQQSLSMSELWTAPVMLRIVLLQKISDICQQLNICYRQWTEAETIADQALIAIDKGDHEAQGVISAQVLEDINSRPAYIEHLLQVLRKQGRKTALVVGLIEQLIAEKGISLEKLISLEHQSQAIRQVSMGNSITALRTIAAIDWNEIFESLSHVEEILRKDPSGYYTQMDFRSRDYYRHAIEKISRFYDVPEINVANKALSCAPSAPSEDNPEPVGHIGYYLVSAGRPTLEKQLGPKPRGLKSAIRGIKSHPYVVYFGSMALVFSVFMALFLGYAQNHGALAPFLLFLIGLLLFIPISDIAINTVNFAISHIYSPIQLPKLELRAGITKENSTMVIIPTLLPNAKRVRELLEKLEVYYLANREENLYYGLVGDFKDADAKETENDSEIIHTALEGISELNRRYGKDRVIFYYFHRQRQQNHVQGNWMGWERKRGAIIEFNDLLSGAENSGFKIVSSQPAQLPAVTYVITLDADTSLDTGAARRLIGTMAHPLNRPVIDPAKGVVVKGHGIIQPRIGVSLESAGKTLFSRIFAGQGGIDPYSTAVSDVYQDLFGEGIFTGKGIYELAAFQKLLKEAIPENTVLSHDLLEGSFLRAGLATDIELIDGYPALYNSFFMRLHRWVRGDWQLIPWLMANGQNRYGERRKNPLSALSKWKIIDNLRRSLVNPALFLLITLGFVVLPGSSLVWLGLAMVTIGYPTLTYLMGGILSKNYHLMEGSRGQTVITGVRASFYQAALQFMFIAYQAYLMTDAIMRTLTRIFVTRKNLLEWIPAADLEASLKNDLSTFFRKMGISPLLGLVVLGLTLVRPDSVFNLAAAGVVSLLWIAAPYAAYLISQDQVQKTEVLEDREVLELRRLARKTWAYFEDMVSVNDNFLPPDNYQVEPPNGKAHRTSPTNIGLLLVSTLAARDFGYLGTGEMMARLDATLSTVEKLSKWQGHLYNWYDTKNLRILRPRYISTVDSGNFVGYLLVLAEGLKEYLNKPLGDTVFAQGLIDTIRILNEEVNDQGLTAQIGVLEAYLSAGEANSAHSWPEVLDSIAVTLTLPELNEKIQDSLWGKKLREMVEAFKKETLLAGEAITEQGQALLKKIQFLIDNTKFVPLFDPKRQLFSIGYNVEEGMLTKSYYDLLASEARLASYIAVARGEVEHKHWFRLGRKLTKVEGYRGLVSWSGTMFEYFMPLLIMKNFKNSLLDMTYDFVVQTQKRYGHKHNIPWGVSESAYYAFDIDMNYQYKAFGVPELGLKRGLGNELVVAPYATVLSLTTNPKEAVRNIIKLKNAGMDGDYGLYESIDYTPVRADITGRKPIVKNFMVHHQGMSMLAFANYFNADIMPRRFHANPVIKAAEHLLQERIPFKVNIIKDHREEFKPFKKKSRNKPDIVRKYGVPAAELPNVHLLSNGSYAVMVSDGGSGYSKYNDMAVARWKETPHGNSPGFFIYIQNINSNNVWSAAYEPYKIEPDEYKVTFSADKAEFIRMDGNIETHTQIVVSPEDNTEIRTVTLTNNSKHYRVMEATSYLEVVLAHPDADLAHPAFSSLFVKTEYVPQYNCLLAVRRPRTAGQKPIFAVHTVTVDGDVLGDLQYETDRAKFIGRNRSLTNPLAMDVDQPLSNSVGAVLDPIMSLRRRIKIEPGHSVKISYTLTVTHSRQEALRLADKYRDAKAIERAFELAWNRSHIEAAFLDIQAGEMETYLNMVPSILFPGPVRRKYEEMIARNRKGQTCLWPYGISGDMPMVLVHINRKEQIDLVYRLLGAHELWRLKGLKVDLVFLAEDETGYVQPIQDNIRDAVFTSHARDLMNRKGGVYQLNANLMAEEDKLLMYAVARIILKGDGGPVEDQLSWREDPVTVPRLKLSDSKAEPAPELPAGPGFDITQLQFYNGLGGFSQDGREYVIHLRPGQHTPAPWINVVANPEFGFNISEAGAGYTWAENSRENKLTPWYNDPVSDFLGEVLYLRDEESGGYWSITSMPVREEEEYVIRHGQGYSSFAHTSHGIEQLLTEFVPIADPVKISLIKLKNLTGVAREISATYYLRPVMGVNEKVNAQYITTQYEEDGAPLLVTNPYNCDFPGRVVFLDASETRRTVTGDGNEFIGVNKTPENPAAMARQQLSGRVGTGLVPCAAMQVKVLLEPGESKEVAFLLGQGREQSEALAIAEKYRDLQTAGAELAKVKDFWTRKLESIHVTTPDKSMDLLLNSWLHYQVVSCRLWSRAAFYQAGGAYGFRDQLQDVMALAYTWPELTRKQILLHASHQFVEGDVQHWWHPGVNKGIRTRYSDDFLWLPYVTADYIECTGDWSILEEQTEFLAEDPLPGHEDERYNIPRISEEKDTVYIHCVRAIDNGLKFGRHGLPLMGSGDWNDGMNTVGHKGQGESVWLGWFLYTVLQKFIPVCMGRADQERAERYADLAKKIAENIEVNAWDGSWYRRAYFDDGTPLGSAENSECKIDSIAQSWSVISGIGRPHRAVEAMQAVENYLVDREAGIIKLLAPPFGVGNLEPGYIKAYIPGVRENGGQYTHAAIWTILAFAKLGHGDKAGELFDMINPINHSLTAMEAARYKVEPYVVAADVYAVDPNSGRGGWSWYTGAAGWMYRVGIEHILGLKKDGPRLYFNPCIPKDWPEYQVQYRLAQTVYQIHILNPERVNRGVAKILHNGQDVPEGFISLVDDGREHTIQVIMGKTEEMRKSGKKHQEINIPDKEILITKLPLPAAKVKT